MQWLQHVPEFPRLNEFEKWQKWDWKTFHILYLQATVYELFLKGSTWKFQQFSNLLAPEDGIGDA